MIVLIKILRLCHDFIRYFSVMDFVFAWALDDRKRVGEKGHVSPVWLSSERIVQ